MKIPLVAPALGLAIAISAAAPSNAQSVATPRRAAATSALGPQHRFFGTLVGVTGSALVIRLRSGRLLNVDASSAFGLGHVSEPLFLGKPTVVDGTLGPNGTLAASAVRRAAPDRVNWGVDR